ncbi:MAG: hypothetical protein HYU75_09055, partial [Betaproteobacteria bacterium]|nr:hypothetical protein [Betaproteobacteria bacterium]
AAKIEEEWEKAWGEWDECVFESQDEDGQYVARDAEWEPPYFDGDSLALGLEPLAARMRPLLARVMDGDLAPGFSFLAAIDDLDTQIGSGLPKWMDPSSGDGCPLGPEVTGCLLEWEWRACRRDGRGAFELADAIRKLEASARIVSLHEETVAKFIRGLGDADQHAILNGITSHRSASHWASVLGNAYSEWFKIHQQLARRWDPALFAETSRKNIAQNWELALPLVGDLLRRKAFDKAPPLIAEAVGALLRLKTGETWDPRETLLIALPGLRSRYDWHAAALRLLDSWRKVAVGLGQEEIACALELQVAVGRQWMDGDAALEAFRRVPSPRFSGMRERLFAGWRTLVVEETVGCRAPGREPFGSAWVAALVDAARAGADGAPAFRRAVRQWLEATGRTPAAIRQSREALGTLTLDLDVESTLRRRSPSFLRVLSRGAGPGDDPLTEWRRRWVKRAGASDLLAEIIEFWIGHVAALVPDPANARGSNYEHCAEWLAAVFELDAAAYRRIVRGWATVHGRRKNLWLALARRKLPL